MPIFERGATRIHYTETGSGTPLLLFAPGGMRSAIEFWDRTPFDPRTAFADRCRVIAMDQRNAGASTGPISAADGWHTYTDDHLALLDHLGIDRAIVMGMCIGGPYCLGMMAAAPERVLAGVLLQPIGFDGNREAFEQMFDAWADDLRPTRPEVPEDAWAAFRTNLFGGDFVFNVSREFVRGCTTPMLVLRGNDLYHPASTSEEIAALAPNAELVQDWKEGAALEAAVARVGAFLTEHA